MMCAGQLLGADDEIMFVAMDLVGSQFANYDLQHNAVLLPD